MAESAKEKLFSLLFGGERELVNIKFAPGSAKDLTVEQLFEGAHSALAQALSQKGVNAPPLTGRKQELLREILARQ